MASAVGVGDVEVDKVLSLLSKETSDGAVGVDDVEVDKVLPLLSEETSDGAVGVDVVEVDDVEVDDVEVDDVVPSLVQTPLYSFNVSVESPDDGPPPEGGGI